MTHRLAIIGLGIMGRRMLENAWRHTAFDVCGVWDPSVDSVTKTRELIPDVPVAASPEAAMAGDPFVLQLMREFGGKIVPGSVRPL